jgi:SagB-type dehydrogenase family enzyme
MRKSFLCVLLLAVATPFLSAQQPAATAATQVALPGPSLTGGMTLTEAIATRRTTRSFDATPLTAKEQSQLLWSAQGVTDAKGHRAAPSASAKYYLHVYVARPDGFFEYVPATHSLQQLSDKDIRSTLSTQAPVKAAPIVFMIAGEYDRAFKEVPSRGIRLVDLEAGHATENMLLQANALKLNAIPVGGIDTKQTGQAASLPAGITPIYLVPVGHPKP